MSSVTLIFKSLYACQHQCGFCHVLHVPRNTSFMSTEAVKQAFDAIERVYAGRRVDLDMSGGEFSMRKDAVELVEYARSKSIQFSSLVLDTMAVPLANESLARSLGALFSMANVSVHAATADVHRLVSASKTDFGKLRAGLVNLFKYFPAICTNTSINTYNWQTLPQVAKFIIDARAEAARETGRETPLLCSALYLPVYRAYGELQQENSKRLQGTDNVQFLPHGELLGQVRESFLKMQRVLEFHGASATLRDFNYPACIYNQLTGSFPENAYGLPNFTNDAYFSDYSHPIEERHSLEDVYPSMYGRVKDPACETCVASARCPGITAEWQKRGYAVAPIDEAAYAAEFPDRLLSRALHAAFFEPRRIASIMETPGVDWRSIALGFYASFSQGEGDICVVRERIASLLPLERAAALARYLRQRAVAVEESVARAIEDECAALAADVAARGSKSPSVVRSSPYDRATRKLRLVV